MSELTVFYEARVVGTIERSGEKMRSALIVGPAGQLGLLPLGLTCRRSAAR